MLRIQQTPRIARERNKLLPVLITGHKHAAHGIPPWSPSGVLTVRDGAYLPNSRWVWGHVPMLWPHVSTYTILQVLKPHFLVNQIEWKNRLYRQSTLLSVEHAPGHEASFQ
jgi:hypothetical protein